MNRRSRVIVLALVVATLVTAALVFPVDEWIVGFIGWVRGAGAAGAAVYGTVYVAATLLLVPGSLLTLGAGFVYGPLWGTALVSASSVTGATCAFLVARGRVLRWITERITKSERLDAVNRAVGDEGFKVVVLLRLTPVVPFVFLNYALGLTRVGLGSYVLGSFLGMLPGTFLYVYLGSLISSVARLARGAPTDESSAQQALMWGGLVATVVVTVYITRLAKRALAQRMPSPSPAAQPGGEAP